MWSGLVFSITFLFSAIASPFWGGLADRKAMAGDAELFDIERQKGHDQAEGGAG
jgi:MFS family permease